MKIKYLNLSEQWREEKAKLLPIISRSPDTGHFVGVKGEEILKFEKKVSKLLKVKHVISVNSGTDALTLSLYALGIKMR